MPFARIGQERIVNSTVTEDQVLPTVAALNNGRHVVTWYTEDTGDGDGLGIRARLYNANGTPVAADFIVNSTGSGTQFDAHVDGLPDGHFMVAWISRATGGYNLIRARIFDADGTPVGVDFLVNAATAGDRYNPSVTALSGNRFLVTWEAANGDGSSYGVKGRLFDAGGASIGTEFAVNTTTNGSQASAHAVDLPGGRFLVVFHSVDDTDGDGRCIRARFFNDDGTPSGDDFLVNTTGAEDQYFPDVAVLADGRFAIIWQSYDVGDGSGPAIRARLYGADGTPQGDDFILNSTVESIQGYPSLSALDDGRFVAVWDSYDTGDGDSTCIRGRVFNADGTPSGDDFIVNATAASSQQRAIVEALPGGKFVVTWYSYDTGDGSGTVVRSQIFDARQFVGTAGADTGGGGSLADTMTGEGGNDALSGLGGNDTLRGGEGNDTLAGGAGTDRLEGGAEDDTYVDPAGDKIVEADNAGTDTVRSSVDFTLPTNVERLILTGTAVIGSGNSAANAITGNAQANRLTGGAGNDTLNGGAGQDTLAGGLDNDTYVNPYGDMIVEAAGSAAGTADLVQANESFSLANAANVENLTLAGTSAINGGGNTLSNRIIGNAGANTLSGLEGNDTLEGGAGNDRLNGGPGLDVLRGGAGDDTYINPDLSGGSADTIEENADGGTDTVQSNATFSLSALAQVERLTLTGSAAINGTGNNEHNTILGNGAANILSGGTGNDTLAGGGGKDQLIGGKGNDVMDGGALADTFRFAAANTGNDRINGFETALDRFDLSGGTFSARSEIGSDTRLTHAGGTVTVTGVTGLSLAQWNALVLPSGGTASAGQPAPIPWSAGEWHGSSALNPGIIPGFGNAAAPDLWLAQSDYL